MTLAALLDLGVPESVVRDELAKLPLTGWRLERTRVRRGALMGAKIWVHIDGEPGHAHESHAHQPHAHQPHSHEPHAHDDVHHPPRAAGHAHRHYHEIRAMLVEHLDGDCRARALSMFDRIAVVEARLHGVPVDEVAFHEVGAVDSIIDIVGVAAALAWLRPARILSRPVPLGGGTVDTAHGRLPVPAPATLELLTGCPVEAGGVEAELTTPTGAAIVASQAVAFGPLPALTVLAVGWGAGARELPDRPNLLRIVAGQASPGSASEVCVVPEANLDDMTGELLAPLLESALTAAALDAWFQPIVMKKGRPGLLLGLLCPAAHEDALTTLLLRESSTLGVRRHEVARRVLPRHFVAVATPYGRIAIKVAGPPGEPPWNVAPELEDCRRAALTHGVPLKTVYQEALAAYLKP